MRRITGLLQHVNRLHRRPATMITRNQYDFANTSPAMVKISNVEKFFHGAFILGCILATPAWVLYHVKEYQGPWEDIFAED